LAGGFAAGVVECCAESPGAVFTNGEHEVAGGGRWAGRVGGRLAGSVAGQFAAPFIDGHDVDVDVLRGDAFELFESLFDVAQVEQVAGADREGAAQGALGNAIGIVLISGEPDGVQDAGDEDETQWAFARNDDAGGDVAARDQLRREASGDVVDALYADTAAGVGREPVVEPGEFVAFVERRIPCAGQRQAVDFVAGGLNG
jgi:hypothetical protein